MRVHKIVQNPWPGLSVLWPGISDLFPRISGLKISAFFFTPHLIAQSLGIRMFYNSVGKSSRHPGGMASSLEPLAYLTTSTILASCHRSPYSISAKSWRSGFSISTLRGWSWLNLGRASNHVWHFHIWRQRYFGKLLLSLRIEVRNHADHKGSKFGSIDPQVPDEQL